MRAWRSCSACTAQRIGSASVGTNLFLKGAQREPRIHFGGAGQSGLLGQRSRSAGFGSVSSTVSAAISTGVPGRRGRRHPGQRACSACVIAVGDDRPLRTRTGQSS
jgi:hypothetical protein